jgi:hypothetical protein
MHTRAFCMPQNVAQKLISSHLEEGATEAA